jgi:hypothetical protein
MRLPPNGRALLDLRRAGRIPVRGPWGHIAILPEWEMDVAGAAVTVPQDMDPGELDFCFVAGLDVSIFTRIGSLGRPLDLHDLLGAVMAGQPRSIAVIDLNRVGEGLAAALYCQIFRIEHE